MSGWLIDTNALSETRRPRPERKVLAFLETHPLSAFFVSVVTLAEIRFGIELIDDPTKRALLGDWLTNAIRPMFENRVLEVNEDIIVRWRL